MWCKSFCWAYVEEMIRYFSKPSLAVSVCKVSLAEVHFRTADCQSPMRLNLLCTSSWLALRRCLNVKACLSYVPTAHGSNGKPWPKSHLHTLRVQKLSIMCHHLQEKEKNNNFWVCFSIYHWQMISCSCFELSSDTLGENYYLVK